MEHEEALRRPAKLNVLSLGPKEVFEEA